MNHYNGFNYEEFYEFVIDFFEADQTPEGKAASTKLLDWWNRYVPGSILASTFTNTTSGKFFRRLLLPDQPCLSQRGSHRLQPYEINTEPAYPVCPPSSF